MGAVVSFPMLSQSGCYCGIRDEGKSKDRGRAFRGAGWPGSTSLRTIAQAPTLPRSHSCGHQYLIAGPRSVRISDILRHMRERTGGGRGSLVWFADRIPLRIEPSPLHSPQRPVRRN